MKKTNKIISLILAVVMVFSAVPFTAMASTIPADVNTVEKLISNDNLANTAEKLITNLNNKKGDIAGTVLRLCFLFIDDAALAAEINGRDVTKLTAEENATILINYLNTMLPTWTSGITEQSWYSTVQRLLPILGISLDLSNVNGVIRTLYTACEAVEGKSVTFGDAAKLKGNALRNVETGDGKNLNVIYALLQWVCDNTEVIKIVIRGNLDLGTLSDIVDITSINNTMKELPATIRDLIYDLIDSEGDFAASAYKDFSADELLAAAFLKLITGEANIAKDAAAATAGLSIYNILITYIDDVYAAFCVEPLNVGFKDFLTNNLKGTSDEIDAVFNWDYAFSADTFSDAFSGAQETGILGQLNNLICKIFDVMLSDSAKAAIGLVAGGNENLNENLAKICRYVLPLLNNEKINLGVDFSAFTAETVAGMSVEEMAVAVLKIFFPGWFHYDAANTMYTNAVNKAETLDQLGVLAAYFAIEKWLPALIDISEYTADIFDGEEFKALSDDDCIELLFSMGIKLAAYKLAEISDATHFELDKAATANWTWEEYLDEIVDWAINFIEGAPAVIKAAGITSTRGVLDSYGPFYKINVILNELIDFSFLTGANDATFKLDTETLVKDVLFGNIFDFDIEALVAVLQKNDSATNLLGSYSIVEAAIKLVDNILTALFEHSCTATSTASEYISCTQLREYTYCSGNGHYISVSDTDADNHQFIITSQTDSTCKVAGIINEICTVCGETKQSNKPLEAHQWEVIGTTEASCTAPATRTTQCSACNDIRVTDTLPPIAHNYENGLCTMCGQEEPAEEFDISKIGDIDNDNAVTAADARLALRLSVGLDDNLTDEQKRRADLDNDGKHTSADARIALRLSVGLDLLADIINQYFS